MSDPKRNVSDYREIYLVGARKRDVFADAYEREEDAQNAILRYIFDDPNDHWIGKLNTEQRSCLSVLRSTGQPFNTILHYYNTVAKPEDQWVLSTVQLH